MLQCFPSSHLCVKRIPLQLINTLELVSVDLCHHETILLPFEDFSFVKILKSAPCEVSLLLHPYACTPFKDGAQSRCLQLVSVVVDDKGQPDVIDLLFRENVEI